MSEQPENRAGAGTDGAVSPSQPVAAASPPPVVPPAAFEAGSEPAASQRAERPEVAVGAAFAGGFVLAMILRRLAR